MIKCKACAFLFIFLLAAGRPGYAQDDLLSLIGEDSTKKEFVTNAFKSTRVITSHSIEHLAKGVLDFRILHRFGRVNQGVDEFFGLDQAVMRLGLDYGITDRLMVGIGRSTTKKELDGFLKYRILWQSKGKGAVPFSVIFVSSITKDGTEWKDPDRENFYTSRLCFVNQFVIGKKFSNAFSLQLSPTMVHRNIVETAEDEHDIYSIGISSRIKLTQRIAITGEYFYNLPNQLPEQYTNPLSLGFDIETGGHVFQLHCTNSLGLNEKALLTETTGKWKKGDIHFGFNISRVFTVAKPKGFKKKDKPAW